MEKQLLKQAAGSSILLMILTIVLSVVMTSHRDKADMVFAMDSNVSSSETDVSQDLADHFHADLASENQNTENQTAPNQNEDIDHAEEAKNTLISQIDADLLTILGERYLMIPKEQGMTDAQMKEDYVYRTIKLSVSGLDKMSWSEESVLRFDCGLIYAGAPETPTLEPYMEEYLNPNQSVSVVYGDKDADVSTSESETSEEEAEQTYQKEQESQEDMPVDPVVAVRTSFDSSTGTAELSVTLNHLYVPYLYEDDSFYYLALKRPREVYDKILVLDAGHGGKHPGTTSLNHVYLEKNINLSILKELKALLEVNSDIKVYFTREGDDSVYLKPRVDLANEAEADFFISIHNNAYRTKYVSGTEVLYHDMIQGTKVSSKKLAELCLNKVTGLLGTKSRGLRVDKETYIIGHSEVPVALVEVGYLSNQNDLQLLLQPEKQALVAEGIYHAILEAYEMLEE